jgi:steroid 5-alpha reductase family enzyme
MTALIIKVSGVALLEKSLKSQKPGYDEYVRKTSAFIPWFPKKRLC